MVKGLSRAKASRRLLEARVKIIKVRWGREQLPIKDRRRLDSVIDELISIGKRMV